MANLLLAGKFAPKPNNDVAKYLQNPAEFLRLITSDDKIIKSINLVSDDLTRVMYCHEGLFSDNLNNVNVVIAAYTTGYGRLKLYESMECIGCNLLYCDTGK